MRLERPPGLTLDSSSHSDARIVCRGEIVPTHRLVLGASSVFLKEVLQQAADDLDEPVTLLLPDFEPRDVHLLLDALYGHANPSHERSQIFRTLCLMTDDSVETNHLEKDPAKEKDLDDPQFSLEDFIDNNPGLDLEDEDFSPEISKENWDIENSYQCEECDFSTKSQVVLKKHEKRHEREAKMTFKFPRQCSKCDHVLKSKSNLWYHMKSKHGGERYPCDQCDYSTTQLSSLKIHVQSKHEGAKYLCDECEYVSTFLTGLRQHKRSKHQDIKYPCDQCTHVSTSLGNLKQHRQIKHDGFKFMCDQCEYTTTKQYSLKEHRQSVHEGIQFPCDVCDYVGKRLACLRRHKESKHFGIRYNCNYCDYAATRKDKLKTHIAKKHPAIPI